MLGFRANYPNVFLNFGKLSKVVAFKTKSELLVVSTVHLKWMIGPETFSLPLRNARLGRAPRSSMMGMACSWQSGNEKRGLFLKLSLYL